MKTSHIRVESMSGWLILMIAYDWWFVFPFIDDCCFDFPIKTSLYSGFSHDFGDFPPSVPGLQFQDFQISGRNSPCSPGGAHPLWAPHGRTARRCAEGLARRESLPHRRSWNRETRQVFFGQGLWPWRIEVRKWSKLIQNWVCIRCYRYL